MKSWENVLDITARLTSATAAEEWTPISSVISFERELNLSDSTSTKTDARQTLARKDVRERVKVLGRALQATKHEEGNHCNLLALGEMHLANLNYRKCKNGTVDQDMCKNCRKEKHSLVNATGVLD